jgi:DNA polymerase elongation subunit (family B)
MSKILLFDIETSPIIATTWSLYQDHINHTDIIQDSFIISAAWKQYGVKKVHATSINDFKRKSDDDDYGVCKALREAFEDVDIAIGHNSDKFDFKKLNARLIYHGLPPLPKIVQLDTLKEIKKIAAFTSHRLDFLGKKLIGHGKIETSNGMWLRAMKGDRKAVKEMVEYNKIDVVRLEEVYTKIKPYIKNHPYLVPKSDCKCRNCGGGNLYKNKIRLSAGGLRTQQYQCKDCGAYSTYPIQKCDVKTAKGN